MYINLNNVSVTDKKFNYFLITVTGFNSKLGVRQFYSKDEAISEFLLIQKHSIRFYSKISKNGNLFAALNVFGILSHRG